MQRRIVVFPHPLGPSKTTNSLSLISRLRSVTAGASSYDFARPRNSTRANASSDGEERITNLRLLPVVAVRVHMEEVHVAEKRLSDYRAIIGSAAFSEILALASKLKGKRIAHVNATAYGGGVAELLQSLVALQRDVGLDAHWFVLAGSNAFFNATKAMHNALQGSETPLSADMLATYRHFNQVNASTFTDEYDYVMIHEP